MKIKAGEFPRPVKLGARAVGWTQESVEAWLDQRISQSDTTQQG